MRRGFIATRRVETEAEICKILESSLLSGALTIHENTECIKFPRGIPMAGELLENGRSFSENLEIRWRKLDDGFRVVALSEDTKALAGLSISEQSYKVCSISFLLWGGYDPCLSKFVEVRIPQFLEYPVEEPGKAKERLRITAYQYLKEDMIHFTRYTNISWNQREPE